MTMFQIKTARGPVLWYMRLCGFYGWASLWDTVYVRPGYERVPRLKLHEFTHLEQMQRDGKTIFLLKYVYWLCKYGYKNNPYEVEARLAETQT